MEHGSRQLSGWVSSLLSGRESSGGTGTSVPLTRVLISPNEINNSVMYWAERDKGGTGRDREGTGERERRERQREERNRETEREENGQRETERERERRREGERRDDVQHEYVFLFTIVN